MADVMAHPFVGSSPLDIPIPIGNFNATLTNLDVDPNDSRFANYTSNLTTTATEAINTTIVRCSAPFRSPEELTVIVLGMIFNLSSGMVSVPNEETIVLVGYS